jgi:predicted molibdopterin-dependent oxidoreductase YjgC
VKGNKLTQLRRSTLGTSPAFYSDVYTRVIDQGTSQTMPFAESILKQTRYTTSTNTVYSISTVTTSTGVITGDGISLSTTISGSDQISVYYGGRLLNKVGTYKHNTAISYDR